MVMSLVKKASYFSYLSMVVIKHHDQGNLQREEFVWVYGSRGVQSDDSEVMAAGEKDGAHILNYKHQAERVN